MSPAARAVTILGDMRTLLAACAILLAPISAGADKTFTGTRSGAWDCAKEPTVHIMRGGGSFAFKGSCRLITVEGGDNRLTVEAVDQLHIVGGGNLVDVGTLDTAHIVGADNRVTWKRARSGDEPEVSAIGAGNQVRQAR
jgi:hypothetical protein